MISQYIGIAYLALQVVAWFMTRIDRIEQEKLTQQALAALRMKVEDKVIADARTAYRDAQLDILAGRVREPNKHSRT